MRDSGGLDFDIRLEVKEEDRNWTHTLTYKYPILIYFHLPLLPSAISTCALVESHCMMLGISHMKNMESE